MTATVSGTMEAPVELAAAERPALAPAVSPVLDPAHLDPAHLDPARLDGDSREWLRGLRAVGPERDASVARLHALLLRAARFEVARRRPGLPHLRNDDLDEIAYEAADDALVSILARLDSFRGHSRFTTWAYKFALLEAAVKLRKRAWQGREVPLEPDSWTAFASTRPGPHAELEQSELLVSLQRAVTDVLTPHQRTVLVALALNGVPIDLLADRLGTSRGALYKTLHDARRKLRAHLAESGLSRDGRPEVGD
jgi:RNA polymerase sigma-70 factor (ECF subfamily)